MFRTSGIAVRICEWDVRRKTTVFESQPKHMFLLSSLAFEPGHEKTCFMPYANNKGADQPAHPRSLISAFVVRCLDSNIYLDSIAEISRL